MTYIMMLRLLMVVRRYSRYQYTSDLTQYFHAKNIAGVKDGAVSKSKAIHSITKAPFIHLGRQTNMKDIETLESRTNLLYTVVKLYKIGQCNTVCIISLPHQCHVHR